MGTFKRTFKLLDVAAEKQVQVFELNQLTIGTADTDIIIPEGTRVLDVLRTTLTASFDRVVIFRDKAIVQGTIHKNLILKVVPLDNAALVTPGELIDIVINVPFTKEVELPGLNPTITIGRFNRVATSSNVVNIGPDNEGNTLGFDAQLYVKSIDSEEILINSTLLDEKIVLDFLIKISKFTQQDLKLPAPNQVFEFRNVIDP